MMRVPTKGRTRLPFTKRKKPQGVKLGAAEISHHKEPKTTTRKNFLKKKKKKKGGPPKENYFSNGRANKDKNREKRVAREKLNVPVRGGGGGKPTLSGKRSWYHIRTKRGRKMKLLVKGVGVSTCTRGETSFLPA